MASAEESTQLDIYQARGGGERKDDPWGGREDVSSRNGRGTTKERFRSDRREPNLEVVEEKLAEMGYYTGQNKGEVERSRGR